MNKHTRLYTEGSCLNCDALPGTDSTCSAPPPASQLEQEVRASIAMTNDADREGWGSKPCGPLEPAEENRDTSSPNTGNRESLGEMTPEQSAKHREAFDSVLFVGPPSRELDHPCRDTCSGWKQGYEKGLRTSRAELMAEVERLRAFAMKWARFDLDPKYLCWPASEMAREAREALGAGHREGEDG